MHYSLKYYLIAILLVVIFSVAAEEHPFISQIKKQEYTQIFDYFSYTQKFISSRGVALAHQCLVVLEKQPESEDRNDLLELLNKQREARYCDSCSMHHVNHKKISRASQKTNSSRQRRESSKVTHIITQLITADQEAAASSQKHATAAVIQQLQKLSIAATANTHPLETQLDRMNISE